MADDIIPLLARGADSSDSEVDEEIREDDDPGIEAHKISSNISYDSSLPAQHTYLGTDLEELSGRTMLEDNGTMTLPLLSMAGVVLIPGQTLPLHLFQPGVVTMMKYIIEKDRTFGMVNSRYVENSYVPVLATIGTTAEIRSYKEVLDDRAGIYTFRIKAEGRQRFEILSTKHQPNGELHGTVRILPEVTLDDALEGARLPSTNRFNSIPHNLDKLTMQLDYHGSKCVLRVKPSRKKYNYHSCAHFTRWPPWVYKLYDEQILMQKIRHELSQWNTALNLDKITTNATKFSFWVAALLPLDDLMRLNLLEINSPIQRLRYELSILEKCTALCCKECNAEITDKSDVFSMSIEGPQGMYVNPGGHVHETLTVYKARNLTLYSTASVKHSWFPGFAWTIAQCRHCSSHMGWKFTATDKNLQPDRFWGLCRSSLQPGIKMDENEPEAWSPSL